MARPTPNNPTGAQKSPKMTPETILKLEQAFSIDATIAEACFFADIGHETYHRWVRENSELRDKFARLREKPVLKARQTVVKDLDNPETAKWYLARKRKKEFSERNEFSGPEGKNIEYKLMVYGESDKLQQSLRQLATGNPPFADITEFSQIQDSGISQESSQNNTSN